MRDYTWPSVYFAYLFFAICFGLAVYFFVRSARKGYWGKSSEDIKYQVFDQNLDPGAAPLAANGLRAGVSAGADKE